MTGSRSCNRSGAWARNREAGLSLIEILIAVLIVSVGILGVAGLQSVSLRNNTLALHRTEANQLASDIIDRIRANSAADYSLAMGDDAPAAEDCVAGVCTPAQMADFDIDQWLTAVAAALPAGDASIVVADTTYTVTMRWTVDNSGTPLDMVVVTRVGS